MFLFRCFGNFSPPLGHRHLLRRSRKQQHFGFDLATVGGNLHFLQGETKSVEATERCHYSCNWSAWLPNWHICSC